MTTSSSHDPYQKAGNLYWQFFGGIEDGTPRWLGSQTVVGHGGWDAYRLVFGGIDPAIYAITPDGILRWYWHDGAEDGTARWKARVDIRHGFNEYLTAFTPGKGVIYAIARNGMLHWSRYPGWKTGEGTLPHMQQLYNFDFRVFTSVFAGDGGVIYGVTSDGRLYWVRHEDWLDGTNRIYGPIAVSDGGWSDYVSVFAGTEGVIYGLTQDRVLYWHRHDGYLDGTNRWQDRRIVSRSAFDPCKYHFAIGDKALYGVGLDTLSWMSAIPSARLLSEITIPGTHDSGTYPLSELVAGSFENNAKCQTLSIAEQLAAGIRFLDIRVVQKSRNGRDDFQIWHGSAEQGNTGLWFSTDVVQPCGEFLAAHPTETIIMVVKDEWGSTANQEQHLLQYLTPDLLLSTDKIPTLGEARGRIVLVRRYDFGTHGIPAKPGWPNDSKDRLMLGNGQRLMIQDIYGFGGNLSNSARHDAIEKKWHFVRNALESAPNASRDAWWINFASASGAPAVLDPIDFARGNWGAKGVNAEIADYLETHGSKNYGTVVLDFPELPNHMVLHRLIRSNF